MQCTWNYALRGRMKLEKKTEKKVIKYAIIIMVIIALWFVLFTVDIDALENQWKVLVIFKRNIRWMEGLVETFSPLAIFALLLVFAIWAISKFSFSVNGFSIAGIEISLKDTDKFVKTNVRNFLNTKRSLFFLKPEYDNFNDVFLSYYSVYDFLRSQLLLFEGKSITKSSVYNDVQDMLSKMNQFLTKYQSDYRRWYEKKSNDEFVFLEVLQSQYDKYEELVKEFEKINFFMQEKAKVFDIDMLEWEEPNDELENSTEVD